MKKRLLILFFVFLASCQNAVYDKVVSVLSLPEPGVSIESGLYSADQTIEVTVPDEAAYVEYSLTMDGRKIAGGRYTEPVLVSGHNVRFVFSAVARHPDRLDSNKVNRNLRISYEEAMPIIFSPAAGDYHLDQDIVLASVTGGGSIYYRTDGREPKDVEEYLRTGSDDYLTETIIFYNNPDDPSDYEVLGPAPVDDIGNYSAVHLYTEPISLAGHGTVKTINAFCYLDSIPSSANSAAIYTLQYNPQASPVFTPETGTTTEDLNITISSPEGGTIHYRYTGVQGGSDYNLTDWTVFNNGDSLPLIGDGSQISIEAYATGADQRADSFISVGTYYINKSKTVDPVISLGGAILSNGDSVSPGDELTMTSATEGANIFISYLVENSGSTAQVEYPYIDHKISADLFPANKTRIASGDSFPVTAGSSGQILRMKVVADKENNSSSASGDLPDPSNLVELELIIQ